MSEEEVPQWFLGDAGTVVELSLMTHSLNSAVRNVRLVRQPISTVSLQPETDADQPQQLAGIGAVRARLIVETRSERLFESLDDAFGRIGLSAKQASNLTLANLRQILASRPTTSPRKRDGARARRSYRKSGRVLARKEGDDPKREYPATIVKVHDCGTVYDIKYDDGTTWKNAPAEVVRLR